MKKIKINNYMMIGVIVLSITLMSCSSNIASNDSLENKTDITNNASDKFDENEIEVNDSDNVDNSDINDSKLEDGNNTEDDKIIEDIEDGKESTDKNNNVEDENQEKKSYYIPLEGDPYADDSKVVGSMLRSWDYKREDGRKIAYLTFDDGPSQYVTDEILDILKENKVKATFFLLGKMIEVSEDSKDTVIRIAEEGHSIANHTFSHRYDILYPNRVVDVDMFIKELNKTNEALKNVLGEDFETRVIRFPGGKMSWKTKNIDKVLDKEGYVSIDWNTLNGDAEGSNINADRLMYRLEETVDNLNENSDIIVVLMHDTDQKETTVQYLQSAIDYLRDLGYEFRTLK